MLHEHIQINVLGQLEVKSVPQAPGPHPRLTITATKLRQVLVLLAVNAGTTVRTEQLIDELWPSGPPQSVRTGLQTYVYQLRKLFAHGFRSAMGKNVLTTDPGGYMLAVPRDNIDLFRFQNLVEEGRSALRRNRFDSAAATLGDALNLWRASIPTDVTAGPSLRGLAVYLDEQRLEAISLRIEADLARGRHVEVIGELRLLVAAHPLHEIFHLRLMQALHGSGRRGEALVAYRQLRNTLNKELGLEPSPEVRNTHQEILSLDPTVGDGGTSAS